MAENALKAVYKGLRTRLVSDGSLLYGNKVRASIVQSNTGYPYCVYFWAGGGQGNRVVARDAEMRIGIKVVSDSMAEAMNGAAQVTTLLDNKGQQDDTTDYVYGGTDWKILSITEEDVIYLVDHAPDTMPIYHIGAFYRVVMAQEA